MPCSGTWWLTTSVSACAFVEARARASWSGTLPTRRRCRTCSRTLFSSRSLRLRQASDRSPQEKTRTALHGQNFALIGRVARPSQGSAAGLHKLADLREKPEAVGG